MPMTEKCQQCGRLAYMHEGRCEFCGYEHTVVGRIVGREIVRETRPRIPMTSLERAELERRGYLETPAWIDRQLFEAYDQLNAVFIELAHRKDIQHETANLASDLADILANLETLRANWSRRVR